VGSGKFHRGLPQSAPVNAGVFYGPHDLRCEAVERPRPGPDEILIDVAYCGICGSDIHTFHGSGGNVHNRPPGPRVIGHEVSGVVAAIGDQVTSVKPGDRVTCLPWMTCGKCPYCRRGAVNHCSSKRLLGGGFAEQVITVEGTAFLVPDAVPLTRAALGEPVSCCVWAHDLGQVPNGAVVLVVGAGTMGLIMAYLALRGGAATVIVSEPNETRRALAATIGAIAIDPRQEDPIGVARHHGDGVGADVAFEVVGRTQTIETALGAVRNGGTVVVVGVADPDARLSLSPYELYRREITLRGCLTRRNSFERGMRWLRHEALDSFVTHTFPIERIGEAMQAAIHGAGGKVLIAPNGAVP